MPTPVQRKALPVIMTGVDTCVMARTGSGKTIAFLVPLLELLLQSSSSSTTSATTINNGTNDHPVRGLILSPTRELSMQTLKVLQKLSSGMEIKSIGIHGGEGMEKQFTLLSSRPDVIVATPGRLAHHLTEIPDFTLHQCKMCILDEADRLIEMGFAEQLRHIAKSLPLETCQKVLLSATMPKGLVEFSKSGFCTDPTVIRLDQEASVSPELRMAFVTTRSLEKDAALLHIVQQHIVHSSSPRHDDDTHRSWSSGGGNNRKPGLTLIFAATRHHVEYLTTLLTAAGVAATMIYGTLDTEARHANLAAFKSGAVPVLVVTDVAARGIDVPLIDFVIHYHFPPSPKLFVHRSGRAARAGRIGYCWCLVEPDELPYMMDLHLFLGRRPTPAGGGGGGGGGASSTNNSSNDHNSQGGNQLYEHYTLDEMTPDMVHYGSLPESISTAEVENVQRIMNSELSGSLEAEALRNLTKVCKNAMMQYRRTRTEASREGVRRAKAILEGERSETGARIGTGAIRPHPLLRGVELAIHERLSNANTKAGGLCDLENLRQRDEFLRAMSNFRPKETVFEAFATGKSKDTAVVSHIDKGRTTKNKKNDSSVALTAMKNMRRQMRMARDKGATLVVAGSANAREINGDDPDESEGETDEAPVNLCKLEGKPASELPPQTNAATVETSGVIVCDKPRMSRAERKRLKKNPHADPRESVELDMPAPKRIKRGADFRDPAYFIDNDISSNTEEAERARRVEAAMQPSSSITVRGTMRTALRMEETMMDIVGDENSDIIKKQRMMRWDKAKRKYVQTTVGEELSGDSKSKKLRTESGQLVKNNKLKLGELYQKWQKRTNRSIGRTGVFDENDGPAVAESASGRRNKGSKPSVPTKGQGDDEQVKTAAHIKKNREKKQNMKIKNMKKGDRRHLEQKSKANAGRNSGGKSFGKGKADKKR
jgi:ATP-dependent RNA helicase DDX54/DBP10